MDGGVVVSRMRTGTGNLGFDAARNGINDIAFTPEARTPDPRRGVHRMQVMHQQQALHQRIGAQVGEPIPAEPLGDPGQPGAVQLYEACRQLLGGLGGAPIGPRAQLRQQLIDTLGGLVISLTDRVPSRGELVTHASGIAFEVIDADPRRIKRLRVRNAKPIVPDQRP